jgi:poly(3-hydroxybutyrate) depolymerase
MFHALYDGNTVFDASKRVNGIPEAEVWLFDQQRLIEQVKATVVPVADDRVTLWWPWRPYSSARRKNLDIAKQGYIYVPPSCRQTGSSCRVHIALHGCRQSARTFATRAGYNNWAEHYKTIVVYPAIEPSTPMSEAVCQAPPVNPSMDSWYFEPNPNGCWDWWGYLDPSSRKDRYLTKDGPQIKLIERIINEVTASP